MEKKEARICRLENQRRERCREMELRFFSCVSTDSHEHIRELPEPGTDPPEGTWQKAAQSSHRAKNTSHSQQPKWRNLTIQRASAGALRKI